MGSEMLRDTSGPSLARTLNRPSSPVTFDQTLNTSTTTTIPAALNVGSLVLLSDVITAIATMQTQINNQSKLINQLIDILQDQGSAL